MRWLRRHASLIGMVLGSAIVVTLVYGLVRRGFLDVAWLKASKEAFAALNNIVAIVAILIGFALSYFRFFAGRTFARRADLSIKVSSAPGLHGIAVTFTNVGTLTIYDPELSVIAIDHMPDGTEHRCKVDTWLSNEAFASELLQQLVDPGEKSNYLATRRVRTKCVASYYAAVVRDRQGNVWEGFAAATPDADS